jgi:hypothetical protein
MSNAEHGRFWRPLLSGYYTYTVRKKGYVPATFSNSIFESSWYQRTANLTPLPAVALDLTIHSNNTPVNAYVSISDPTGDDEYEVTGGHITIDTFTGNRVLTIIPETGIPWRQEINFTQSTAMSVNVATAQVLFSDDFQSDLGLWYVVGPWKIVTHEGRKFLTDSWGGYGFYAHGCDVNVINNTAIAIPSGQETYLVFDQHLYTEWEHDYVTVAASVDKVAWTELYRKAGKYDWWHNNLIDLSQFAGQSIYLRFRLQDDTSNNSGIPELTDPGWSIDNLRVVSGLTSFVSCEDETIDKPKITLNQNYPNPFNPSTKISFTIENKGFKNAFIDIFNVKGQRVSKIAINENDAKNSYVVWNANGLGSGVYLYRLSVDGRALPMKKAVLLK